MKKQEMKSKKERSFKSKDFWDLMESQEGKCALTGIELTPFNTEAELREPFKEQGRRELDNHYLVARPVSHMARYISESEIIELAIKIIETRGKEYGVSIRKLRK